MPKIVTYKLNPQTKADRFVLDAYTTFSKCIYTDIITALYGGEIEITDANLQKLASKVVQRTYNILPCKQKPPFGVGWVSATKAILDYLGTNPSVSDIYFGNKCNYIDLNGSGFSVLKQEQVSFSHGCIGLPIQRTKKEPLTFHPIPVIGSEYLTQSSIFRYTIYKENSEYKITIREKDNDYALSKAELDNLTLVDFGGIPFINTLTTCEFELPQGLIECRDKLAELSVKLSTLTNDDPNRELYQAEVISLPATLTMLRTEYIKSTCHAILHNASVLIYDNRSERAISDCILAQYGSSTEMNAIGYTNFVTELLSQARLIGVRVFKATPLAPQCPSCGCTLKSTVYNSSSFKCRKCKVIVNTRVVLQLSLLRGLIGKIITSDDYQELITKYELSSKAILSET